MSNPCSVQWDFFSLIKVGQIMQKLEEINACYSVKEAHEKVF